MKKTLFMISVLISMICALTITVRAASEEAEHILDEEDKPSRAVWQVNSTPSAEAYPDDGEMNGGEEMLYSLSSSVNMAEGETLGTVGYTADYIISGSGEDLGLYKYEGDSPVLIREGELSDILSSIDGGRVAFNGVKSASGAEIPRGDFIFTGDLDISGTLTVGVGACVDFTELSFTSSASVAIRLKGGSLNIENSEIYARRGVGVLLDYSSTAALALRSGCVVSESKSPAIELYYGKAELTGGRVECAVGAAVYNDSSLLLGGVLISGVDTDIITDRPITLSDELPSSHLNIEYTGELVNGSLTELFYSATPESVGRITLKNQEGVEYKLTYFDKYEGRDERNFLAVYLPYTVRYYSEGLLCHTEYRLSGETITGFETGDRVGYDFVGWMDAEGVIKADRTVDEDTELFASFALQPPAISIDSYTAEYTGSTHTVGFSSVTHPLDSDGGFCEFEWILDGLTVFRGSELSVIRVGESGEYSCKVTYRHRTASVTVLIEGISVNIVPKEIDLPRLDSQYFDGVEKLSGLRENDVYSITEPRPVNAGSYTVVIELYDKENYAFENGDSKANLPLEILPAENGWISPPRVANVFAGSEPAPSASSVWGTPVYRFYEIRDGKYAECKPKLTGKYYLVCEVAATDNYSGIKSEPIPFEILEEKLVGISIVTHPKKTDYIAFEKLSAAGLTALAKYNSGREELVGAELLSISYQTADSLRFGDTAVLVSYLGCKATVPVNVSYAEYDITEIKFTDVTIEYDGTRYTYSGELPEIIGLDGSHLNITVSGGGRDVGEYELTLSFSTDSLNYAVPEPIRATLKILPRKVMLVWSDEEFVYSGETLSPSAYYTDVFGVRRYPTVFGGAASAGGPYEAVAQAEKNYIFENPSIGFSISKAEIDVSTVRWSTETFIYNGEERRVELLGLPRELTLLGYTDNKATEAGKYTARAIIAYDERNYLPPTLPSLAWEITKAHYDTSSFSVGSVKITFDGAEHFPQIIGELPVGKDGSSPTYSFSGGATHVAEGEVSVLVEFFTSSKNYYPPEPITATVQIEPLGITVEWQGTELVYNGELLAPTAHSPYTSIRVDGGATAAGRHTAKAISENTDYDVISPEIEFIIRKAENKWVTHPAISNIYEGGELSPRGEPFAGELKFIYYSSEAFDAPCEEPREAGVYYMVAYAEESENHLSLRTEPIRFEIIKVVAVAIRAELVRGELYAMETLSDEDILITLIFNNGKEEIWSGEREINYQHAESLRARDTELFITACGFSSVIGIEVKRATLDTSRVAWTNTLAVYSGKPQSPELLGLPEGVELISLGDAQFINAGQYEVRPLISYDEENYEPPSLPPCVFTIKRQTVTPPILQILTYNGAEQEIPITSELFTLWAEPIIGAGKYLVKAELCDPDNYEFAGGESSIELPLTVLPIELVYRVSNAELYLFEELGKVDREHIGGEVIEGDELTITQRISGNKIILSSSNPNYSVRVVGGNITRYSTLSPEALARLVLIVLIVLLLIIILLLLYFGRHRLFELALVLKHRIRESVARRDKRTEPCEAAPSDADDKDVSNEHREPNADQRCEENKYQSQNLEGEDTEIEEGSYADDEAEDEKEKRDEKEIKSNDSRNDDISESYHELTVSEAEGVDMEKADSLITDSLAKDLIKRGRETVRTEGKAHSIINVDTLSEGFTSGERVDVNILKSRGLVPYDTAYLKVLARGIIDKPLKVYANEFSLSAVKMIALTGGEAIRVVTLRERSEKDRSQK
ncbi:MAG: uL15 family ribosomal protein [Clostridia bacterium]|nr:uL15 family ribosomal protein [Clostridia bacterium]